MLAEVARKLHFHYMESTGTIGLWCAGRRIARYKPDRDGSRQFFRVGKYFIKAEYVFEGFSGQCADEIYTHGQLRQSDKQYFIPLLACSDVAGEGIRWTLFPWYNLTLANRDTRLYDACYKHVSMLCERYSIDDVKPYFNLNWFIHKSKPLIVDCGIRRVY